MDLKPIGTKVTFIRQNQLEAPENGHGTILGYALDPNKRIVAHIDTGTEKVNVDIASLNPTEAYLTKYAQALKDIKAIGEEGNSKVSEIVAKYNGQVEEVFKNVLSEPVILEEKETKED